MKRPILIICLGYSMGIILGVYTNLYILSFINIVFIFLYFYLFYNRSKKIRRYIRVLLPKSTVCLILVTSVFSGIYTITLDTSYKKCFDDLKEITANAIVIGEPEEKEYTIWYTIKIVNCGFKQIEKHRFYLKQKKTNTTRFKDGDILQVTGIYQKPSETRNENGFDESLYFKTKQIYGTIELTKNAKKQGERRKNFTWLVHRIQNGMINQIQQLLPGEEGNLLVGLLLGKKQNLSDNTIEFFRGSSLSHMLAVSGMHVSYLVLGITFLLEKTRFSKRSSYVITIIGLLFFMCLADFTPSVVRAGLMEIVSLTSKIIFRKNDIITSFCFSLCIILIINPFSFYDIGLQLSYSAVIGILMFYQPILRLLNLKQKEKASDTIRRKNQLISKIKELLAISFSAQIFLIPIMITQFHTISFTFFISNLLASPILGISMIAGIAMVLISFCLPHVAVGISYLVFILLKTLLSISQYCSYLPFSNLSIKSPKKIGIFSYFFLLGLFYLVYYFKSKKQKLEREKRWILQLKKHNNRTKKMVILILCLSLISFSFYDFKWNQNLEIFFIDVGQGDCTFIKTEKRRTILIDGGGSNYASGVDVGKSILLPYLLSKRVNQIDYIMISHFDSDHCQGLFTIMRELKVKNVIIGKQFENCENYEEFKKIVKEKKIKVHVVEAGQRIKIEKDLYFDVLWPDSKNAISENSINNNSLVCKLVYQNFSILFTGDIEEIAEKAILEKYKNTNILQSTILKVAHHGSKSSSTKEFLNAVKPKIALIGVGEKNTFGHPNADVLKRLEEYGTNIFRTDLNGEIMIRMNRKGKIWIDKMLN